MTTTDVHALRKSALNDFLFADIGAEANGTVLRVVSVFARAGQDPWREADRLAQLSPAMAIPILSRLISGMHPSAWSQAEAEVIAARLVVLLPDGLARRTGRSVAAKAARAGSLRLFAVLFCLALAAGYLASNMIWSPDPAHGSAGSEAATSQSLP